MSHHCCTFFGHHDCPDSVKLALRKVIFDLIENRDADLFYVGNHGQFDAMAASVLKEAKEVFPQMEYAIVLAYMPGTREKEYYVDELVTLLPEGIETVPKRFAIDWRNRWMLYRADYVVTYVTHAWGGAAKYHELAIRQKKTVFDIADDPIV